jgi:hypothetical protein
MKLQTAAWSAAGRCSSYGCKTALVAAHTIDKQHGDGAPAGSE